MTAVCDGDGEPSEFLKRNLEHVMALTLTGDERVMKLLVAGHGDEIVAMLQRAIVAPEVACGEWKRVMEDVPLRPFNSMVEWFGDTPTIMVADSRGTIWLYNLPKLPRPGSHEPQNGSPK